MSYSFLWMQANGAQLRELAALYDAGRAVTRERIMREMWDTEWLGATKTLENHILALRRVLAPDAITTLRGVGYRLETEPRRA